ncbi:hypothetical protein C8R47DRAFT_950031, partial [Mycena vitilis]
PVTAYSISYDIYTLADERDSPLGWNAARAKIYRRLKLSLTMAGFTRSQYSDWVNPAIAAPAAYNALVSLENIPPPHKLSSTVKGLRMSRMDHLALLDVTALIRIGGAAVMNLRGPVPAGLV